MNAVIRLRPLVFHLVLPIAAGLLTCRLAGNAAAVYGGLRLPRYAPTGRTLAVLWIVLGLAMGMAAYLVSTDRRVSPGERNSVMGLYSLLILSACLWGFMMFRFRLLGFGAWWTLLLLVVALLCATVFSRIRRSAGVLMAPMVCGVLLTGVLSFFIAVMN